MTGVQTCALPIYDGIVEQIGAPLDLYDRPGNLFVAGFIGSPSMNFLKGKLAGEGGRAVFKSEGGLTFPAGNPAAGEIGKAVTFGFRPEHLAMAADGVKVQIIVIEPTGSETQVVVKSGSEEFVCLFRDRVTAKPGETIGVTPDPGLVHLFDAATGLRMEN